MCTRSRSPSPPHISLLLNILSLALNPQLELQLPLIVIIKKSQPCFFNSLSRIYLSQHSRYRFLMARSRIYSYRSTNNFRNLPLSLGIHYSRSSLYHFSHRLSRLSLSYSSLRFSTSAFFEERCLFSIFLF